MVFPAHIRQTDAGAVIQTSAVHCRNTAAYAGRCLRGVGLEQAGTLAGLVHDCGKFKAEFTRYLESGYGARGSVNHTFAGVRLLLERYHGEFAAAYEDLSAELLAFAAGAHHGLFDCVDEDRKSGFSHREMKNDIGYEESKRNFLSQCASRRELDELFAKAHGELAPVYEKLADLSQDPEESAFYLGLLSRLLLSAVIEGDRRDTAEFMGGFALPPEPENMVDFWKPYLDRVERKLDAFPADTPIRRARRTISSLCCAFAEKPGGVYRLNVPTGAGKTLSALRYALAHAGKWGKRRLVFTSPLLSILEQNAAVLREFLGDDSIILEHHSNVMRTEETGELDLRELAVESWNAPVIITTLVQLLNTLFDGRTTAIRRFQGLCGSVIVIDEVQTVPPKLLSMFDLAVDFLAEVCGATVLLCSATQPCLERAAHPLHRCDGDLVPYSEQLWAPFRRTVITDAGGKTLEEIAGFCMEILEDAQSLLLVCNKKDEAEYLFQALKDRAEVSRHLSASMCVAHRRKVLAELEEALAVHRKCLCVSTQVIEAGVDISFQRVIRLCAGMDSVVQAAGRCNRHGEEPNPAPVYVVNVQGEDLRHLSQIKTAKDAAAELLFAYRQDPARFDNDLASDAAIRTYYQNLYRKLSGNYQDCYVEKKRVSLFELLSCNFRYYDEEADYAGKYFLNQAFKLAGGLFQVFDSETRDLVVPYGGGTALIAELTGEIRPAPAFLADWQKRARPYTVAVYDWQLKKLGSAVTEHGGIAVLGDGFYDEYTGLCTRPLENGFLEV